MDNEKFPYIIKPVDIKVNEYNKTVFSGEKQNLVEIGPKKFIHYGEYIGVASLLYNFEVRPDDVWIVTFPKSGTTLTQELTWLIVYDDYETALKIPLMERVPFLEFSTLMGNKTIEEIKSEIGNDKEKLSRFLNMTKPGWETLQNMTARRIIKTHLPFSLLPQALFTSGCKVIYVARNPKDRSSRHRLFCKDFSIYWDLFQNNSLGYTPFWEHVKEGWEKRGHQNFLFLFFEDMIKDYKDTVIKVSKFLEKDMSKEKIEKLADHLHIDNIRKNVSVRAAHGEFFGAKNTFQFVRKGKSGGWRDYFTADLNDRANRWIEENYKKTDLRFPVDLN